MVGRTISEMKIFSNVPITVFVDKETSHGTAYTNNTSECF